MARFLILCLAAGLAAGSNNDVHFAEAVTHHSTSIRSHRSLSDMKPTVFAEVMEGAPTTKEVTDACLEKINALRTDNLETSLGMKALTKDQTLEGEAKTAAANLAGTDKATCDQIANASPQKEAGVVLTFPSATAGETSPPNCAELLDATYKSGLEGLVKENFDPATKFTAGTAPFNTIPAMNLAFLMWTGNETVGCAYTTDCAGGTNVLYCKFKTALANNTAPFSQELFEAMEERSNIHTSSATTAQLSSVAVVVSLVALLFH